MDGGLTTARGADGKVKETGKAADRKIKQKAKSRGSGPRNLPIETTRCVSPALDSNGNAFFENLCLVADH